MNQPYSFTPNEIDRITNRFGKSFYEKVAREIVEYAERWALSAFQLIPSYSANLVFTCYSEAQGNVVLKIGNPASGETSKEYHTLRHYEGRRFCRVYEADLANGAILEERVQPGTPLRHESSLDKRLSVFCSLYKDLHLTPGNTEIFPTYTEWVGRITEYMRKRHDCEQLCLYMKKAEAICTSVSNSYSQRMLLHGDFHHDNILLGHDGEYVIIDPKGVIGDPVFDVPRFILNEFDDEITMELFDRINYIIGTLANNLHIPSYIIKQCLFVETAMGVCWSVEDGANPEEYPKLLQHVAFADTVMNS